MPEKTRSQKESAARECIEKPEAGAPDSWSKDQQEKGYYYDDAFGYEVFNPDEDEEDEEISE